MSITNQTFSDEFLKELFKNDIEGEDYPYFKYNSLADFLEDLKRLLKALGKITTALEELTSYLDTENEFLDIDALNSYRKNYSLYNFKQMLRCQDMIETSMLTYYRKYLGNSKLEKT